MRTARLTVFVPTPKAGSCVIGGTLVRGSSAIRVVEVVACLHDELKALDRHGAGWSADAAALIGSAGRVEPRVDGTQDAHTARAIMTAWAWEAAVTQLLFSGRAGGCLALVEQVRSKTER